MVAALRLLAKALWLVAVAAIVIGVGMIILNGGTWPDALAPVQNLFQNFTRLVRTSRLYHPSRDIRRPRHARLVDG